MTLVTPKANYKVFIISQNKYYSGGYRSKATWVNLGWAINAAKDAAKRCGGISNIEIHEFPMSISIKHSLSDLIQVEKEKALNKAELEKLNAEKRIIQNAREKYLKGIEEMKAAKKILEQYGFVTY